MNAAEFNEWINQTPVSALLSLRRSQSTLVSQLKFIITALHSSGETPEHMTHDGYRNSLSVSLTRTQKRQSLLISIVVTNRSYRLCIEQRRIPSFTDV